VKKRLTFTSAGHNPALWWQAKEKTFELLALDPTCVPLGLTGSEAVFASCLKEKKVDLQKGDIVVLYTDGVTEAMDSQNRPFGLERLQAAIQEHAAAGAADKIIHRLDQDISRFCGDVTQSDDIAVVAVKID
jgi:phosphoserine phosphatase RsbU/P